MNFNSLLVFPGSPLKINRWKMNFLLGNPIFVGYVSFRECTFFFLKWRRADFQVMWYQGGANSTPRHDFARTWLGILHPGRLTWKIQITHFERKIIFQTSMIMFHANLPGCRSKFRTKLLTLLYRHPNFHVIFYPLEVTKNLTKIASPRKVTFKLADIPTKWSLEVPQKGNQEIKPPNLDLFVFFLVIFDGKKRSHGMKITMKNPTIYGEYVWNLFQAPTFATLSNALGGISRLAVALPEDDTLEVWSFCDSWFVGLFLNKEGSQETSSPTKSIA